MAKKTAADGGEIPEGYDHREPEEAGERPIERSAMVKDTDLMERANEALDRGDLTKARRLANHARVALSEPAPHL